MTRYTRNYIKEHYHKGAKCLMCGQEVKLCVCDLPVLELEKTE